MLDGAKALAAAVGKVFGDQAAVQRCTLHKRRNVAGHLPKELAASVDKRLAPIFSDPDAAGSLREGLEDMFTVRRMGITGALAKTLTNTNCIESMISITRRTTRRVTRWKDGSMKKRWIAAGMLEAERSFRRVRGHADMPKLVHALQRHVKPSPDTAGTYDQAAA